MVVAEDLSPAEPALQVAPPTSLDTPVTDTDVSENLSGGSSDIGTQVQSMFASFAKSLEVGLALLMNDLTRFYLVLPRYLIIEIMSARMLLIALLQLPLQWPCDLSIRLIRLPLRHMQMTWEPP